MRSLHGNDLSSKARPGSLGPTPGPGPGRSRWGPPPGAVGLAGWALLPLRGFLGVTFIFAGLQKLSNPGFFDASNPASIQAQLAASARSSPLHAFVSHLQHAAVPIGVVIALAELAVGLGTLLGLWARVAAAGGLVLSLSLFLTVSFHSSPYYTGSDIVFVFAWTPLVVAGTGGVLSADGFLRDIARRRVGADAANAGSDIDRRTFALQGMAAACVGVFALFAAGLVAGVGRALGRATQTSTTPTLGTTQVTPPATASPGTSGEGSSGSTMAPGATTSTTPRPAGTAIGSARDVPVGGAASFQDPGSGDPSLVVQPVAGTFVAFDAVCPHAGCIVGYSSRAGRFVCPCHGSEFNGRTGAVIQGPAPRGLGRIPVTEGPDGELYVT